MRQHLLSEEPGEICELSEMLSSNSGKLIEAQAKMSRSMA